ncbi:CBS domain-containing protein [Streptomyces griseorubiginosus]
MHGTPHIVSDVMTRTVTALGRGATFEEIVRIMQDRRISALPLLEGGGRVVGVVSEADLLPKEEFRDSDPDRYTQVSWRVRDTSLVPVAARLVRAVEGLVDVDVELDRSCHEAWRPPESPSRAGRP